MESIARPVHGGLDPAEARALGVDPRTVIDFSASINPLGTPSEIRTALSRVDISAYPDRDCTALREALACRLKLETGSILVGNGSTELIHCLARALLAPGRVACIFGPTFGEYAVAGRLAGAVTDEIVAAEGDGFLWPEGASLGRIRETRPDLVFLCNPNNPTGTLLDKKAVEAVASATRNGLLVIDEAYMPFADEPWDFRSLLGLGNVALLRSLTKDFGMAGLRLGYLVASEPVIQAVKRVQPSWSVNTLAQAAGLAALDCDGHIQAAREIITVSKAYLKHKLQGLGMSVGPSRANFVIARVGDAAGVRRRLLQRGLCVRDCASFGLPHHIRIGMRRLEDCQRLIEEMERVLPHG